MRRRKRSHAGIVCALALLSASAGAAKFAASQAGTDCFSASPVGQTLALNLPHSADYETYFDTTNSVRVGPPDWTIDTFEASRLLGYWRAGAYHLDASAPDGYEAGPEETKAIPHSADCETYFDTTNGVGVGPPDWTIDTFEASRLLGYWRAGAYHLDATAEDGYEAGPGETNGTPHSADYETYFDTANSVRVGPPDWTIDTFEASRLLGYWRAGAYHLDASAPDGYEAGPEEMKTLPHSADCETYFDTTNGVRVGPPDWTIDTFEASRLLGYWRAGAYHLDATAEDGYEAGPGETTGTPHSADYETYFDTTNSVRVGPPDWTIDTFEASRLLGYWRAGAYHLDASTPDGYEAGPEKTKAIPHSADYETYFDTTNGVGVGPPDWTIDTFEASRLLGYWRAGAYHLDASTVDGYEAGPPPDTTPPADVSGFTATPGDGQVALAWLNPSDADFAAVRIQRKTGGYPTNVNDGTMVYSGSGTNFIDAGLTNDTAYFYKAFSRDAVPNYSSGVQATATPQPPDTTPPADVTGFTATPGDGQVALAWLNPSDADFAAVRIQRTTDGYPTNVNDGATVYSGSGTNFIDAGLTNGTAYFYKAFSRDAVPNYSGGVQATATPQPPDTTPPADVTGFTATPGDGQVALAWLNPSDADFAAVRIQRTTGGYPTNVNDGATVYSGSGTNVVDAGLTNGTAYYYKAFSRDAVPNYSGGVQATATPQPPDTTPPADVTGFTATPGDGQVALAWLNPSEADFAAVRIQRKTGGYPTNVNDGTTIYSGSGTNVVDAGLTNGTAYYYKAFSRDAVPNYSGGVQATATPQPPDTTPPADVTSFTATPGDGQVALAWLNPGDADFAAVRIQRTTDGYPTNVNDGATVYSGSGTNFIDAGLTNGTAYYYKAFSRDAVPNYSGGVQATATPQPPDTTPPADVTGFTATPGDGQVALAWLNPSDADFAAVRIQRTTDGYPTNVNDGATVYSGSGTNVIDAGLTNGTAYYYKAFSRDAVPNYSGGVQATATPQPPDTTPPADVSGFTATPGDGQVALAWLNPSDADFAAVRIQRTTDGYPTNVTDGATVYGGSGTNVVDAGLTNGTAYFYKAFSRDAVPNYSDGVQATATPQPPDTTPPADVTGFTATPGDGQVALAWLNPGDADFAEVRIQRTTDGYPTNVNDGATVYSGGGTNFVDAGLTNGTAYYYKAFSRDAGPNYSDGVQATATPAEVVTAGMVLIPSGVNSGTDPDFGAYSLTNDASFYMDRWEVTKTRWDEVYTWAIAHGYTFTNAGSGKETSHPVQMVSWHDCVKWCNARSQKGGLTPVYYTDAAFTQIYKTGQVLEPYVKTAANGFRLPTDVQWQYAARGGVASRRFPWADSDTIQHARANYRSSSLYSYDTSPTRGYHPTYATGADPYTSPAGSFAANGYGLYDMAGNVWEWCYDWYPGYAGSYRLIHGSSWSVIASCCRVGFRLNALPAGAYSDLGFRTVLPPEP